MIRFTFIVTAALAALVASTSAQASVIVWNPGSGGNGHAYEYVESSLIGWDQASATAQAMTFDGIDGHLATITDGGEQFFISNIAGFDPEFFPEFAIGMWIGGFQPDPSDAPDQGWAWVTGEQWSFTDWGIGEPDDAFGPESHLAMYVPTALNFKASLIGWGDFPGDEISWFGIHGFLVEYDVPAPGALSLLVLTIACGHGRRRRLT